MKDFKFLRFLDKFKPVFEKLGIDYPIMRKILRIKLIMDGRRVPTILADNKNSTMESDNKFLKSLGLYLFMGLMLIPFVWMRQNYIYQMSITFTIIIFFLMTTLISDFSSVLLDIKDKNIIGTKPVDPKTLHLAKTIHISLYMFYITASFVGPALLASLYRHGFLFFIVFLVSIILLDLLIIVLTFFVYFVILRLFNGEKLKDIINYIQIILTIAISVGYQLFGRLFNIMNVEVHFAPKWWQYLIIPVWFSAPFQMIKTSEINSAYILFTAMAIVIPLLAMAVYIRLMPLFEKNLQKLSNNSERRKKVNKKPVQLLSKILCHSKEERVFFRFAYDMMKNEREFKLKVYPSLGFAIVFPYIFLFQQIAVLGIKNISQEKSYFYIYFCGIMLPIILLTIRYSSTYKGAWIYKAMPIHNIAPIFRGSIKAVLAKLFLPLYILHAIAFVVIFGIRIIPDILVIFLNIMIFNILCFIVNDKSLPFSEAYTSTQQDNVINNFLLLIVLGLLAGLHYLISKVSYGVYIYLTLAVMVNFVLWATAFKISPNKIKKM